MMITTNTLRAWGACWSDDDIAEMYMRHGVTSATHQQIAECEDIELSDRIWVLCHVLDSVDRAALQRWALDVAERALAMVDALGQRSTTALDVARRYLDGHATREEFSDAAAADAAVYTAARAASCANRAASHASHAAVYTAEAATCASYVADAAAHAADAAGTVIHVVTGIAARLAQIAELLSLIEAMEVRT